MKGKVKLEDYEYACMCEGCTCRRMIVQVSHKKASKWMYELWEIGEHKVHDPVFRSQYIWSSKQKNILATATKYNPELSAAKLRKILKDEGLLRGCEHKHMHDWVHHFRRRNRSKRKDLRVS